MDAVAVDAQGHHVRGLTAADFTLLDRGKPVEIATFEEVQHERVPRAEAAEVAKAGPADRDPPITDVASNQAVADDRLVVMVVDDLHIYRRRTDQTKKIARDVVSRLGPGASMAVLFTSGDRSTEITRNRRALTAVIDQLEARRPFPRPAMATTAREAGTPERAASGDYSLQNYYEQVETIRTLRDASRLLKTGDTARKAFVLISEWMPKDLSGLYQAGAPPGAVEGGEAYAAGNLEASSIPSDTGALDYEFIDMMDAMRRSNVVTYAIDPRGEVSSKELMAECHPSPPNADPCLAGSGGPEDWTNWVRQSQHGLEFTSEASGGFAITNTDDFTGGLDRIVEDLDHYYLLGFYPSDPGKKGYRPLEVRVNRPGVTVRFRHGYEVGPAREAKPKNDDPLVELAAGVIEKRSVPIRLVAMPMPNPGVGAEANPMAVSREVRVDVAIEVSSPVDRLRQADGTLADSVRYTVLAANLRDGKVAKQFTNTAEVSSSAPVNAPPGAIVAYQLPVELSLLPGRYQIRAAALSDAIGDGGSVYLTLDVPDYRRAAVAMSALVLGYADGRRLPVTTGGAARSALPFTPTLDREFRSGERLRVYFEVAALRTLSRITVDVVDAAGKTVLTLQPPVPTDTRMAIGLPLSLEGLAPGEYTLRASAVGTSGRGSQELTFRVR